MLLQSYTLQPGESLGFINDLDLESLDGRSFEYRIRIVISRSMSKDLTEITSYPLELDPDLPHPRCV